MRPLRLVLLLTSISLAACRAGAREGLGPTGVPLATAGGPESRTGPASDAAKSAPLTIWKAEYYKISDG